MTAEKLNYFKGLFGCDVIRITAPCGRLFLIVGYNRNTKDTGKVWHKNNKRIDFNYVEETVVAHGDTEEELIAAAEHYKRLLTQEGRAVPYD